MVQAYKKNLLNLAYRFTVLEMDNRQVDVIFVAWTDKEVYRCHMTG